MDRIEEAARALGKMLKESPEYSRFTKASRALEGDTDLKELLDTLAVEEASNEEKISKGGIVEVSEKRKLKELREKARAHAAYSEFLEAEREYIALMKRVNDAMNEAGDS